ncbi:MAG: tetratricopeptide repeat protein, partial [Proteobacteria bacterium]|nr:tetratricopeptide repeat protein [Pseudomonadota bacterium]
MICSLLAAVLVSCATIDLKGPAPETDNFQSRLILGRQYLNTRHHSLALAEFTDAGRLRPGEAAPVHGRAEALFHMGRMDEALAACSELGGESPDYFIALGFCWGIRLEVGSAAEEIRENVRQEIAELLNRPEPSVELLYSAYQGYYYLNDQEKRFALIRQLIEKGNGSAMTAEIASTLFSEIIESPPGSDRRLDLAERYIRNFSDQRMADKAATIVFRELSAKQQDEPDHQQLVRSVLQDKATSPYLNGAAAFWLIEHNTDFPQAIHLLQQSLRGIEELSLEIPEPFSETLWGEEIENFRMLSLYLLGRARLGLGETAEARKLFTEVAAMKESWPGPHHFLGMIHLGDGQPEQALQFFRKALVNGSPRPETTTELRAILSDRDGFNGDPRTYFQTQEQDGVWFTDVTVAAGLDGVRASRVAWGDYDNDGDDDLLLDGSRLFSNQGDGGFVPDSDRLAGIAGSNGGVFGDYDNDGSLDIFVTSHGGNHLLHNEDGVRFVESGAFPQTASPFLRT